MQISPLIFLRSEFKYLNSDSTRFQQGGERVEIIIKGEPKEIAALVVEVQGRHVEATPGDIVRETQNQLDAIGSRAIRPCSDYPR